MARGNTKALIADEHILCRAGLRSLFKGELGFSEVVEAADFPRALSEAAKNPTISFAVISLGLPGMIKGEGLRQFRIQHPLVRIAVVTSTCDRALVLDALSAGVHGYIPKDLSADEMLRAFRSVLSGQIYVPAHMSDVVPDPAVMAPPIVTEQEYPLTGRQLDVLRLLATGRSNKEIARALHITEGTVKVHVTAAFRMLGVHNRVNAAAAMLNRFGRSATVDTIIPTLLFEERHGELSQNNGWKPRLLNG